VLLQRHKVEGMQATFPSTAESVDGWLESINMSKYKDSFAAASLNQVSQLCLLTDQQLKEAGVTLVGHRKRLLQASKELLPVAGNAGSSDVTMSDAMPVPTAEADMDQDPEQRRFNSTSSIFINSTITRPDIDEIIFCVAVVIHDRVVQGEQMGPDARARFPFFSEDNNPLYAEPAGQNSNGRDGDDPSAKKKKCREVPQEETIFHTIRSVYECARFPSECLIVSLVYMERLIAVSSVPILVTSWRPILLAALILAQKVWDDRSLHNLDFSIFCPMFTLKEINHLERKFLELIDFDVSVNTSLYASYYFQLRTLCQRENREFTLKPMDASTAAILEARGLAYTGRFKKERGADRQWQSANDIDPKAATAKGPGLLT